MKHNGRFSPFELKPGKILKNRIVVPPMASETASQHGTVTDKTIEHYERLCRSGAGLVFVEYSFVNQTGRSEEHQLAISEDAQVAGLKKLASVIKRSGALAGIQLTHAGGKSETSITNNPLQSPSGIRVPVKDKVLEKPNEMSLSDIEDWKKDFLNAATRAVNADFDVIELHAAHGYGLNQWLSPLTNKRTDFYSKGINLILEIIEQIFHLHPDLLISVRMPGQDFFEGGLTLKKSLHIAQKLEDAGVAILNISSGIGGWKRPRERTGEGYLVEEAACIQRAVTVPVIGVGGLESGDYIDQLLTDKKISLAAVGRAILKDPEAWAKRELIQLPY